MMARKYTDEQLKEAIKNSRSWRQTLPKVGLKETGGNHKHLKKIADKLNIDYSHFTGQSYRRGAVVPVRPAKELSTILVENSTYGKSHVRQRLLKAGLKQSKCECCNLTEWFNKPIPLELDHINGINNDHRIENLRLLCPNCHAQTDTYRGKNIARLAKRKTHII